MKTYIDKNYGADADGNRGITVYEYELEDTQDERDEIAEILYLKGYTSEDDHMTSIVYEDVDIEVDIGEYCSELCALEALDDDIPDLEKMMDEAEYRRDIE
jgi:hypothetical protein